MKPDYIPAGYDRIQVVDRTDDIFNAPFGAANCILHPRRLSGDFNALALAIQTRRLFCTNLWPIVDYAKLRKSLPDFEPATAVAAQELLADMDRFASREREVRYITPEKYQKQLKSGANVIRFHADAVHRVLSAYNAPVTEGLRNDDVVAMNRADFKVYFDARADAVPFRFQPGDLWRQRGDHSADSFVHRAPAMAPDFVPRLLLVVE